MRRLSVCKMSLWLLVVIFSAEECGSCVILCENQQWTITTWTALISVSHTVQTRHRDICRERGTESHTAERKASFYCIILLSLWTVTVCVSAVLLGIISAHTLMLIWESVTSPWTICCLFVRVWRGFHGSFTSDRSKTPAKQFGNSCNRENGASVSLASMNCKAIHKD